MLIKDRQDVINEIEDLLEEARKKVYSDYSDGLDTLNHAYTKALEVDYKKGIAWALLRFGSYSLSEGKSVKAIEYYKVSLNKMKEIEDLQGVSRCHYSMATVYALMSHYDIALNHYLNAMSLSETYDPTYYSKLLNNIAYTYCELEQYQPAIEITERAIQYMKKHNEPRLYMLYSTMGEVHLAQKSYNEALKYSEMALSCLEKEDNPTYRAFANMTIAGAYKGLNFFDEALIVYNRTLKLQESLHNYQNSSSINLALGDIYLIKKEYNYAFRHCQLAMTLAIKHKSKLDEANVYKVYADLYESLLDYKKAYESYKNAIKLEKEVKSAIVDERYRAYHIEHDIVKYVEEFQDGQIETSIYSALNHTLGELKSTYLNLSKEEKSQLTDAFVEAVVDTIDLRDTTTSGHSKRIAKYSLELMHLIHEDKRVYPEIKFSDNEMKEMYYAALMHDIGKLAINEAILLKDRRLSEDRFEAIEYRFFYMKSCLEVKLENSDITVEEEAILNRLDDDMALITSVIFAYKLEPEIIKRLKAIHQYEIIDCKGKTVTLIDDFELENLTVKKGNLISVEWEKMKSHAKMTEMFLKEIPWLRDLENVPMIAASHHEKLDGSGYPRGLSGDQITIQMRILSIVDIFEALTASDRPYKATKTVNKALKILWEEANDGKLDKKLLKFFEDHNVCYLCKSELENISESKS